MTYAVLLLGATGLIGSKIAQELAIHKNSLNRIAFLTPDAKPSPEKEKKYSTVPLERITGALDNSASYEGWISFLARIGLVLTLTRL
jgi:NAD dependent epimerase/dehydratase family enzyme